MKILQLLNKAINLEDSIMPSSVVNPPGGINQAYLRVLPPPGNSLGSAGKGGQYALNVPLEGTTKYKGKKKQQEQAALAVGQQPALAVVQQTGRETAISPLEATCSSLLRTTWTIRPLPLGGNRA